MRDRRLQATLRALAGLEGLGARPRRSCPFRNDASSSFVKQRSSARSSSSRPSARSLATGIAVCPACDHELDIGRLRVHEVRKRRMAGRVVDGLVVVEDENQFAVERLELPDDDRDERIVDIDVAA